MRVECGTITATTVTTAATADTSDDDDTTASIDTEEDDEAAEEHTTLHSSQDQLDLRVPFCHVHQQEGKEEQRPKSAYQLNKEYLIMFAIWYVTLLLVIFTVLLDYC